MRIKIISSLIILVSGFIVSCNEKRDNTPIENGNIESVQVTYLTDVNSDSLIKYLGYSIESNELKKLLNELKINITIDSSVDVNGNQYWVHKTNPNRDLILEFNGLVHYLYEFGKPNKITNEKNDELILTNIDINLRKTAPITILSVKLPFNLEINAGKTEAIQKLGIHPTLSDTNSLTFEYTDYELLLAFNKNRLNGVFIKSLDEEKKVKNELRSTINSQVENIKKENINQLRNLKTELPTNNWKLRKAEGDNIFTEKIIKESENILNVFIDSLMHYTERKSPSEIYNSIYKVCENFNSLNEKEGKFIETMEREEICIFIDRCIRAAGLQYKENVDLTLEWRDW